MKKILLIITLVALAAVSQAQFVASLQLGGSTSKGSSVIASETRNNDTIIITPEVQDTLGTPIALTGGLKFGYQFGRFQAGITGSFTWNHYYCKQSVDEYGQINPDFDVARPHDKYTGWYKQKFTSYSVAPYFRCELINFGDVTLFAELDLYYTKVNDPQRQDFIDWYAYEMHNTIDTSYDISLNSVSLGAKLVPGMTWQLSKSCSIELYFDFMAFCYDKTTFNSITVVDEYDYTAEPRILARRTTTTVEQVTTEMGFGVTGSPLLNNDRNWIRAGFNYTF